MSNTSDPRHSSGDNQGTERIQRLIGGDYLLRWVIGHGGMSTVWLATDVRHDRDVAVKILRPEFSDNREFLDRFRNEAAAAERISSVNVVRTFDYREVPDPAGHTFCFIVMEYVRGESLADLIARRGFLDEDLALDVLEQAAHGLSVIHQMGLVHRDIKPGNILITEEGRVKITDFGIAKAAAAVPLTRTGMVVGTAQYVSPEQAQGKTVTSTSDIYSLGVVGYEMLSGRRPFSGDSSVSVAIAHINQAPPQMGTSVSARTRELIGISLRKDPERRFADGNEMALAVHTVRMGERPPQPRSAAMDRRAPAPTPTESTRILGQVTNPTTVQPAVGVAPPPVPVRPVVHHGAPPQYPAPRRRGGGGLIAFLVLLLLAALTAVAWLLFSTGTLTLDGITGRTPPSSSPVAPAPEPEPTVVTEITTTTVPAPEPAPGSASRETDTSSVTTPPPAVETNRETVPPVPDAGDAAVPSADNVGERTTPAPATNAGTVTGVEAPVRSATDSDDSGEETP
ncbi:serine/threonine-protein kinase [Corynebacterium pygosceleis]|uniref:non-specific serine/threonine protein kinase n=1 Tax=Corynebacterium pygosceleis TaxID=2800406 RepID=A0A9Q4GJS1_9CORY|nr:serine/threonine-protein kinase [Corynebacterium pygosceleis]MCK7637233.1 protein kinase [Corynebacterium pygosceleis]MCK7676170.1 protein kinase [Corynebacterium pygosceleis]MCL0119992.1 protein kinase [Corynebacterium pygosceleis]MCX7445136.1 protein kinase [Corynebacterium pygosceleis]MCX7468439.1 protein kinase [Corynebacterium pygosceleis]